MTQVDTPMLLLGIGCALFGWTLYWLGMIFIGTFLGGSLGIMIGMVVTTWFELPDQPAMVMIGIATTLGAVLGWMLMKSVQFFFFFLVGFSLGAPLAYRLLEAEPFASQAWTEGDMSKVLAVLVGGAVGGAAMVLGKRYVIALVTALFGAALIAGSLHLQNPAYLGIPTFVVSLAAQTGFIWKFMPRKKEKD